MILQNLHTHTEFCDGKNTMEEMVISAIKKGFSSLGFSGHSYMPFQPDTGMNPEEDTAYKKEAKRLKDKYKDKIQIFTGLEYERHSLHDIEGYDYVIGSCHFLDIDGEKVLVDTSPEDTQAVADNYFGGDGMRLAKKYFETMCELCGIYPFDIIGHFDVITKNQEKLKIFDTESSKYRSYALEAVHTLSEKFSIFEVNSGVMARSSRSYPYPERFILEEMKRLGCSVTIGSDCHRSTQMGAYHSQALDFIRSCGFKEIMIFDGKEFVPTCI